MEVDILSKALAAEAALESLKSDMYRLEVGGCGIVGVRIHLLNLPSGEDVCLNSAMSEDVVRIAKKLIRNKMAEIKDLLDSFGISNEKLKSGGNLLNEIIGVRMTIRRSGETPDLSNKIEELEEQLKAL